MRQYRYQQLSQDIYHAEKIMQWQNSSKLTRYLFGVQIPIDYDFQK